MTPRNLAVALLTIVTGLLAIYAISHRWYSEPLGPRLSGTRNNVDSIAAAREPGPLLGVVLPRPGIVSH